MTNHIFRSVCIVTSIMLVSLITFVSETRAEEFRKWSPKGQEPFYGKLIGYSPEKTEVVIEKHGASGESVRIPISSVTGADAKLVKDFIARSKSTSGRPDSFKPSVEDRRNDRWNLNPILSISLPDRAAGWRLTNKSPLTFTAVDLEDNKKPVLTTYIAPPAADDKAFQKYWKQLLTSIEKQLRPQGIKELPADLEPKEVASVNRINSDRMFEATTSVESTTLTIRIFRGSDATIAFVAQGSAEEITAALKGTSSFTYQTQARNFFGGSRK